MLPAESNVTLPLAPLKYVEKAIVGSTAAATEAAKKKRTTVMGRRIVRFIQLYRGTPSAKSRARKTKGLQPIPGLSSRRVLTQRVEYLNARVRPNAQR